MINNGKTLAVEIAHIAGSEGTAGKFLTLCNELQEAGEVAAIEVVREMVKEFPAEQRKADPKINTAYQYASSFKAIFGAFLHLGLKPEGGINLMRKTAVDALKDAGIKWDGSSLDDAAKAKADKLDQTVRGSAAQLGAAKIAAGELDAGDLASFIDAHVSAAESVAMFEAFEKAVERQAANMVKSMGKDEAIAFAARLLEVVSA